MQILSILMVNANTVTISKSVNSVNLYNAKRRSCRELMRSDILTSDID